MKNLYKLFLASALVAAPHSLSAHPFKIEPVVPEVELEWSGDENCVHQPADCNNPNISASDIENCPVDACTTKMTIYWCSGGTTVYYWYQCSGGGGGRPIDTPLIP